jgi:hypothetical protein
MSADGESAWWLSQIQRKDAVSVRGCSVFFCVSYVSIYLSFGVVTWLERVFIKHIEHEKRIKKYDICVL